ncbi:MAG: ribonuclease HI family protein [Thaumarchaeota archaeon]|nr:ribonuclease HI family protein [Nitrososphaerota archaeon]
MYQAYSDGFCKPNPGIMGIGGIIIDGDKTLAEICENLGPGTNNLAEYLALIAVLRKSLELGIQKITAYSDSELLVNQVNGKYKVKNKGILEHWMQVMKLVNGFQQFSFEWIPREKNQMADKLSEKAYYKRYEPR